jgi:hypothetical protein
MLSCAKLYKASVRVIVNNYTSLSQTPPFLALSPNIQTEVTNSWNPKKKT